MIIDKISSMFRTYKINKSSKNQQDSISQPAKCQTSASNLKSNYTKIDIVQKGSISPVEMIKADAQRNLYFEKLLKYSKSNSMDYDNKTDILEETFQEIRNSQKIAEKYMSKFGYGMLSDKNSANFHKALVGAQSAKENNKHDSRIFYIDGKKYKSSINTNDCFDNTVLTIKDLDDDTTLEYLLNKNTSKEAGDTYSISCITTKNRKIWLDNSQVQSVALGINDTNDGNIKAQKYYKMPSFSIFSKIYADENTTIKLSKVPYIGIYNDSISPQNRYGFDSQNGKLVVLRYNNIDFLSDEDLNTGNLL